MSDRLLSPSLLLPLRRILAICGSSLQYGPSGMVFHERLRENQAAVQAAKEMENEADVDRRDWSGGDVDVDRPGGRRAARRPSLSEPPLCGQRARAATSRHLSAREAHGPAAAGRLDSRRRLGRGQQRLLRRRAAGGQGLRRGRRQLPPQPARPLPGPDRGLQGGHPLAAGQRGPVSHRSRSRRRLGTFGRRAPGRPAGDRRRREGV